MHRGLLILLARGIMSGPGTLKGLSFEILMVISDKTYSDLEIRDISKGSLERGVNNLLSF